MFKRHHQRPTLKRPSRIPQPHVARSVPRYSVVLKTLYRDAARVLPLGMSWYKGDVVRGLDRLSRIPWRW